MCLIALALGASPDWPLLMAGNRDEFFDRPTLPLARWQEGGGTVIVSGRDLQAGGTCMGITPGGRVAVLTNVREPGARPGPRSRGELPLGWLRSEGAAERFLDSLDPEAYSGFNLVMGDLREGCWHWASNRQGDPGALRAGWQHQALAPGVYGLSNALLDTPWPKTLRLKQALACALEQARGQALDEQLLWQALADSAPAPEHALPRTGVAAEAERHLSSAFVRFPDGRYGTRASTLLVAQPAPEGWVMHMQEKTWAPGSAPQLRQERVHTPGC